MGAGLKVAGMRAALNHVSGYQAYGLPTLRMALLTTIPTATSSDTEVTTAQYQSYARVTLDGSAWTNPTAESAATYTPNAPLPFAIAGGSSGGCIIWGYLLIDQANTPLWYGTFVTPVIINAGGGTGVTIPVGALTLGLSVMAAGVGFSQVYTQGLLAHMIGKTPLAQPASLTAALTTTLSTPTALGTEATYTHYARSAALTLGPAGSLSIAAATSPSAVGLTADLPFGSVGAASAQTIAGWALLDGAGVLVGASTVAANNVVILGDVMTLGATTLMLQIG